MTSVPLILPPSRSLVSTDVPFSHLCLLDMECADVPLLTPSSKEMMSQALKATFSGFTKEQQRLGIPKGRSQVLICANVLQARVVSKQVQVEWVCGLYSS